MFFLIANEFFLRLFHLELKLRELLSEPVGGACGGIEAGFVILLDVSVNETIDGLGGDVWIRAGEA